MPLLPRFRAAAQRIPGVVLVPVLAFLALTAWAFASPVGASPDDDFHLSSIWCGLGDRGDLCEPGADDDERTVARDLVVDSVCYAYHPDVSARCQGTDFGEQPGDTVSTDRGNFTGVYPPVFYGTMSLLASDSIEPSVVGMRLVNAALFVGALTATWILLPVRRRPALLAGAVLTAVPLAMFIVPSTNPSSWAILSAAVLWPSLVGWFETTGPRRYALGAIAAVATVMGAGARSDAAAYSVIGVGIAMLFTFERTRTWFRSAILGVALVVIAVLFYFAGSQSGAAATGLTGNPPGSLGSWLALMSINLVEAPQLWVGALGGWGLGWLDTDMPDGVWVASFGVFAGAITLGLASRRWRSGLAIGGLTFVLLVLPSYILTQSSALVGGYVQPRYLLPLLVILGGVALSATDLPIRIPRPAVIIAAAGLACANSLALYVDIRRYVTGIDVHGFNLDSATEWWWDAAPAPLVIWALGSLAFAGVVGVLGRAVWPARQAGAPVG